MKLSNPAIFKAAVSAFLAVGSFAFFTFAYPHHLHYHEDLQLFLYTCSYAASVIGVPGGMADYLSRFVVQFFVHSATGAALLSLLLLACQWCTWLVMPRRTTAAYGLSIFPALMAWAFLCDANAMPSAPIALVLALLAARATMCLPPLWPRAVVWLVATPLLYFLGGALALIYVPVTAVLYITSQPQCHPAWRYGIPAAAIAVAALCPVVAHQYFAYPLSELARGLYYMRYGSYVATLAWIAGASVVGVQLLSLAFVDPAKTKRQSAHPLRFAILVAALTMLPGAWIIGDCTDMALEDVLAYHYLAGQQKWREIVQRASNNPPQSQMSLIYTNLALAKTGALNDRLLEMPQHGTQGLIVPFGDNFFLPFATAEAYYQMGMLKAATLYTYEIQQSVPDAQMSARTTRRLAELYMLNGNTDLARKYLKLLTHSLYYSDWANKRLKMLNAPTGEYAALATNSNVTNAFFNETDPYKNLQRLCTDRPANTMAYNYLIAWMLLNRDIEPLPGLVRADMPLPKALQQALVLVWAHDHTNWDGMPWPVSDEVKNDFIAFSRSYSEGMPPSAIPPSLRDTYWAYYFSD